MEQCIRAVLRVFIIQSQSEEGVVNQPLIRKIGNFESVYKLLNFQSFAHSLMLCLCCKLSENLHESNVCL